MSDAELTMKLPRSFDPSSPEASTDDDAPTEERSGLSAHSHNDAAVHRTVYPQPQLGFPELRKLVNQLFPLGCDLEAFMVDFFPAISRELGSELNRTTKITELFRRVSREDLTSALRAAYPDQLGKAEAESLHASVPATEESARVQYIFVLSGSVSDLEIKKLKALVTHLRKISGDSELTIEEIKEGSIRLVCEGSTTGLRILEAAMAAGKLSTLLEFNVLRLEQSPPSFTETPKRNKLGSPAMLLMLVCLGLLSVVVAVVVATLAYLQRTGSTPVNSLPPPVYVVPPTPAPPPTASPPVAIATPPKSLSPTWKSVPATHLEVKVSISGREQTDLRNKIKRCARHLARYAGTKEIVIRYVRDPILHNTMQRDAPDRLQTPAFDRCIQELLESTPSEARPWSFSIRAYKATRK